MLNFKQRATIETMIRNLNRLEATIREFLDISRIQEGKMDINREELNINSEIIKEVEDTFVSEIYENNMIFENKIPENLTVNTDRNMLTTIFNNLISNAIKYGLSGGRIIIDADEGEKSVRFGVYNDGKPIN